MEDYEDLRGMELNKISRQKLIDIALMVSDNLALIPHRGSAGDLQIEVISMARLNSRALIVFDNLQVLHHNMTEAMLKRAIDAVKRNKEIILDEIKEASQNT